MTPLLCYGCLVLGFGLGWFCCSVLTVARDYREEP